MNSNNICQQGKYRIWGKPDWSEPLNTYCVIVLPPAERKSAVISLMTAPLEAYEQEVNAAMDAQISESQMKKAVLEKERRMLEDKVSKGKADAKELAENRSKAAIVSAEGGIFDILNGIYTKNVNLLLRKKYTVDFLTKTMKVNEGEVPQYYVKDSHPAIIKPAEWEAVQVEMEQRRSKGKRHDCKRPFSGMIFCGDCGGVYGSKVWHSNDPYRRVIWRCNHKYDSGEKCGTPHIREEVLKERFRQALSFHER